MVTRMPKLDIVAVDGSLQKTIITLSWSLQSIAIVLRLDYDMYHLTNSADRDNPNAERIYDIHDTYHRDGTWHKRINNQPPRPMARGQSFDNFRGVVPLGTYGFPTKIADIIHPVHRRNGKTETFSIEVSRFNGTINCATFLLEPDRKLLDQITLRDSRYSYLVDSVTPWIYLQFFDNLLHSE